jgi:hypothetical protein
MKQLRIIVESSCMDLDVIVPENKAEKKLKEIKKHYEMISTYLVKIYVRGGYNSRKRRYINAQYTTKKEIKDNSYIKIQITSL